MRIDIAAGRIAIVAGSGISVAASAGAPTASWTGLLHSGIDHCASFGSIREEQDLRRLHAEADSGSVTALLRVAGEVSSDLGAPDGGEYCEWLRKSIGSLTVVRPDTIEALANLGAPILTTNYDGLIEEVTSWKSLTWKDGPRIQRVLRGEDRAVIHVHGYWENPATVVLDQRGYSCVIAQPDFQLLLTAFRMRYSFLFVGFGGSIADPHFSGLLSGIRETFHGREQYRNYFLVPEAERAQFESMFTREDRMTVLAYGETFDELAPFLRRLAPETESVGDTSSVQPLRTEHSRSDERRSGMRAEAIALEPRTSGDNQVIPNIGLVQVGIPRSHAWLAPRHALVQTIMGVVRDESVVVLTGSTGVGKTGLAKLIAVEIGGRWLWMNASDRSPAEVRVAVGALLASIGGPLSGHNLLLDDVDLSPAAVRSYQTELADLVALARLGGSAVLISSQRAVPAHLSAILNVRSPSLVAVPGLTEQDIGSLCLHFGCGDASLAARWARVTRLHTGGHALLTHVQVYHLCATGWPALSDQAILQTPESISRARGESRSLLGSATPEERQLAYRLSILVGPFRRDVAIAIGEADEAIECPGDALDGLTGPWIEPRGNGYFGVCSLLSGAAAQVWPADRIRGLHGQIADAFVSSKPTTTVEASAALFHAVVGGNGRAFAWIAMALLGSEGTGFDQFARDHAWLLSYATDPPVPPFGDDGFANFALRLTQIRVAGVVDPACVGTFADILNNEHAERQPAEAYDLEMALLAAQLLLRVPDRLPPGVLIRTLRDIAAYPGRYRAMRELVDDLSRSGDPLPGAATEDLVTTLFDLAVTRRSGADYLNDLVSALDTVETALRLRLLGVYRDAVEDPLYLIARTWESEAQRSAPEWHECIRVFRRCRAKAIEWGVPSLAAAAARGAAVVFDEYLADRGGALDELANSERDVGPSIVFVDARATVRFNARDYVGALDLWRRVERGGPQQWVFTWRRAAIAAAEMNEWSEAAAYCEVGRRSAEALSLREVAIGFAADQGFCAWQAGRKGDALRLLEEAIRGVEALLGGSGAPSLESVALGKGVSQTLLWLDGGTPSSARGDFVQPRAGLCSDPAFLRNEALFTLPPSVGDFLWALLARIECDLATESRVFESIRGRLLGSPFPSARLVAVTVDSRLAVRHRDWKRLVGIPGSLARAVRAAQNHASAGRQAWEPEVDVSEGGATGESLMAVEALASGLIVLAASAGGFGVAAEEWRRIISEGAGTDPWLGLEGAITKIKDLDVDECNVLARQVGGSEPECMLAMTKVVIDGAAPRGLLVAGAHVVCVLSRVPWGQEVGPMLSRVISERWRSLSAQRSLFLSPDVSMPRLLSACDESDEGMGKAARVLLFAGAGIGIGLPAVIRELALNGFA